jgi:hypothetical protein
VAPWIAMQETAPTRQRVVFALYWITGMVLFAYAGRLILVWWTLAFPLIGAAASRLAARSEDLSAATRNIAFGGMCAIVLFKAAPTISPVFWLFEGDTVHRILPRSGEDPALWLPSWLLCHTQAGAGGKVFTEFNYGSELNWRLPGYSPSIDGRTIFPDSDAVEFAFYPHGQRRVHASTYTRADVALLDRSSWLAPILDQDTAWVLVAQARRTSRGTFGALWAKRAWWARWGTPVSLPALDVRVADPRATCAATGVFPKL